MNVSGNRRFNVNRNNFQQRFQQLENVRQNNVSQQNNLNRNIQNRPSSTQNPLQNTQASFGGLGNMPELTDRQLIVQNNGQNAIPVQQPQELQQQNSQSGGGNDDRSNTPPMSPKKTGKSDSLESQISDIKRMPSHTSVGNENQIGQSPVPDAGMPTGNGNLQQTNFNALSVFQGQNLEENENFQGQNLEENDEIQRQIQENEQIRKEARDLLKELGLDNSMPENGSDPKAVGGADSSHVSKINSVQEKKEAKETSESEEASKSEQSEQDEDGGVGSGQKPTDDAYSLSQVE